MTEDHYDKLSAFIYQLENAKIAFSLQHYREDAAVSVVVAVPGERWEVDFLNDGRVDVECFRSDGEIHYESVLSEWIARFSDEEPTPGDTVNANDIIAGK